MTLGRCCSIQSLIKLECSNTSNSPNVYGNRRLRTSRALIIYRTFQFSKSSQDIEARERYSHPPDILTQKLLKEHPLPRSGNRLFRNTQAVGAGRFNHLQRKILHFHRNHRYVFPQIFCATSHAIPHFPLRRQNRPPLFTAVRPAIKEQSKL